MFRKSLLAALLLLAVAAGPASAATFVSDPMTDTTGTLLSAHTTSTTWTKHPTATGNAQITAGARVRNSAVSQTALYTASGSPANANYSVSADYYTATLISRNNGVTCRTDTTAQTFYLLRWYSVTGALELYKFVAGTATLLDSAVVSTAAASTHAIKLNCDGTAISGDWDGTQTVSATDSAITAAGKAGVRLNTSNTPSDTVGAHLDNVAATDIVAAGGCSSTVASVAAAQTAVNGASGGQTICLSNGTYGTMTLDNNAASSRVTLKAVNPLGAVFTGKVILGSKVGIDGLDVSVTGATGDCVALPVGESGAAILNSYIHDCGRDGIRWDRPLQDNSNATSGTLVDGNLIETVGVTTSAGNSMTVRGDTATVTNNEMTDSRNDAVDLWGDGHLFRYNYIHDITNAVSNHNDAFQTWQDYASGYSASPLTNLTVERNRVKNITGPDSHGAMIEGSTNSGLTFQDNLWDTVGTPTPGGSAVSDIQNSPSNVWFLRNTYYNAGAISFSNLGGATGGKIIGNIFGGTSQPYVTTSCTCTKDYNLAQNWTPAGDAHALGSTSPGFVSAGTDFHLASGSAAVNSGDPSVSGRVDMDGQAQVSTVDRGAYERP